MVDTVYLWGLELKELMLLHLNYTALILKTSFITFIKCVKILLQAGLKDGF